MTVARREITMAGPQRGRTYEQIRADLLAEAQAVGVHTRGAPMDPVLELLINGFARELESLYGRVDQALEFNRRTLLRNYFAEPFLESPAQTVVGMRIKKRAAVGPALRIAWQRPIGRFTPEYAVVGEREMVPMELAAAFYCVGNSIYRLRWDETFKLTSTRHATRESFVRPCIILGLTSSEPAVDSGHLSLLVQPNDNGIPGLFPGSDPQRSFCAYLDSATWHAAAANGDFSATAILAPPLSDVRAAGSAGWSRFPTEASLFARMEGEHLDADLVRRFAPGVALRPSAAPAPIAAVAASAGELADVTALGAKAIWLQAQLPYVAAEDPRALLSLIAVNARLAIGYHRDARDRFNFTENDYNVQTEVFELGLADRPGQFCRTFGRWVVTSLIDKEGNEYPYVYDAFAKGEDRWFTLEAGADDVTLIVHVPRRKVPKAGHFDLYTGHLITNEANTPQLDILARLPANGLDFPEIADLQLLLPARAGGDGYPTDGSAPDSLQAGGATVLARQYARAATWLRTRDRLMTVLDLKSFLHAMDARVAAVRPERGALTRDRQLVPGVRLNVRFDPQAQLAPSEQEAICRMATRQIEARVPAGMWVDVLPEADSGPANTAAVRPGGGFGR
jgi:hypothetical protein